MEQQKEEILLQINHLRAGFATDAKTAVAVDDVSIAIPKGKIIGIVGESGCGKSMTARCIMGLLKYPGRIMSGEILLEGQDLTKYTEKQMRNIRGKEISMIFQEPMTSLNPVIKVGKQVEEMLRLHQKISKQQAKEAVLRIFAKVGISEPEKRYHCYPHELSGGLRQRIMIAMAIICKPKVLIADEPTTALDVTIEAQILELIKTLTQENAMGCLMISHNLGVIAQLCDEVYVMYAGQIVEHTDVYTLFQDPQHPYTKGLLKSIIPLDQTPEKLETIPGMVPNLLHLPQGCRFAPRCGNAVEKCHVQQPDMCKWQQGHEVRCFVQDKGGVPNAEK